MTRHPRSQELAGAAAAGLVFVAVLAPLGPAAPAVVAAPLAAGVLAGALAARVQRTHAGRRPDVPGRGAPG